MNSYLCFTIHFLQPYSHARGKLGQPEWPPAPLRLFQALIAAAAGHCNERREIRLAQGPLGWLEARRVSRIVAPPGEPATARYRLYVPNNFGDEIARSWSRGGNAEISAYRTEKDVWPTRLESGPVHYLFDVAPGEVDSLPLDFLGQAARSITHLGWGIDQVVADARLISAAESNGLPGDHWLPSDNDETVQLRVPVPGTLAELTSRHQAFLHRLDDAGSFRPVPPLTAYRQIGYRRSKNPLSRPCVVFRLLRPQGVGPAPFDTLRRTRDVAGMLRALVARVAAEHGWPSERICQFVHGKTPDGLGPARGEQSPPRFSYLPLPTITPAPHRKLGLIRRVALVAPPECAHEIAWARRALARELLIGDDGNPRALLEEIPRRSGTRVPDDWVTQQFLEAAQEWSTVTPVILPRHPKRNRESLTDLLWLALAQAGLPEPVLRGAELEWRGTGYQAGVELASRYLPPANLSDKPRVHVKLSLARPVAGPLAIGSGRYRGFGLLARHS